MKRIVKNILVLAVIVGIMLFTCPEDQKHVDKVTKELIYHAQNEVGANTEDSDAVKDFLGELIGGTVSKELTRLYVENNLIVEDYALVNVGKMKYKGEDRIVSIGAFNHVFSLIKFIK